MLNKKVLIALAIVVVLALGIPAVVSAQAADDQAWSSYITYYTPSTTGGNLQISYYEEASSVPINADPITLSAHASGELFIGSTSIPSMPASFAGSAVLSSDVPVVATYVQAASGAGNAYPRPLYTGFNPTDADDTFYIPTFLNNKFKSNTSVGIQNVGASQTTADVYLYALGASTPTYTKQVTIEPQSTVLLRGTDFGMSTSTVFNGSMVIETTDGGQVVASAIEYHIVNLDAKAFEGVSEGSMTVYMPSMMCNAFTAKQITYYAIQNAGSSDTDVDVTYYNKTGAVVGSASHTILGGNKVSINPCADGVANNTNGSAVLESDTEPILVVGKVNSVKQTATGFLGLAAGSNNIAASYIRWSGDGEDYGGWRSYIAVMNVGSAPATAVVANYYDASGTLKASHDLDVAAGGSLGQYIKVNTNPYGASALDSNGDFGADGGGSVEIISDQPILVVVRVSKNFTEGTYGSGITKFAEDYNGVAIAE